MKSLFSFLVLLFITFGIFAPHSHATTNATVSLASGWNIVSTPKITALHTFSAEENVTNFDIYVLDASKTSKWATMAELGQTEFTPLYGYFVNNKTGVEQTLTFNFDEGASPLEKFFERTFTATGWYSIGVANSEYAKTQTSNRTDMDNQSNILSLLAGKYDSIIDFTDADYATDRKSVAMTDPWKAALPSTVINLNDFRETKGYVIYIKEENAKYAGFQTDTSTTTDSDVEDKIIVKVSSEDPDATTLQVEDDDNSDFITVFAFDIDTDNSPNDIVLNSIPVTITVTDGTFGDIVNDLQLVIDGEVFDDWSYVEGDEDSATVTVMFDIYGGYSIMAGEQVTAELQTEFKALTVQGATIQASVSAAGIVAESGTQLSESQLSGSAYGDTHTLRTEGAVIEFVSATETQKDNSDATTTDDSGTFVVKFDVTAFESDLFINKTAASGTAMGTVGVNFLVTDGSGTGVSVGTPTQSLSASADTEGGQYKISEGETETFTLTVSLDPSTTGFYGVQLYSLNFNTVAGNPDTQQKALPAEDYETDPLEINN